MRNEIENSELDKKFLEKKAKFFSQMPNHITWKLESQSAEKKPWLINWTLPFRIIFIAFKNFEQKHVYVFTNKEAA
jgi:hypothetical protein